MLSGNFSAQFHNPEIQLNKNHIITPAPLHKTHQFTVLSSSNRSSHGIQVPAVIGPCQWGNPPYQANYRYRKICFLNETWQISRHIESKNLFDHKKTLSSTQAMNCKARVNWNGSSVRAAFKLDPVRILLGLLVKRSPYVTVSLSSRRNSLITRANPNLNSQTARVDIAMISKQPFFV